MNVKSFVVVNVELDTEMLLKHHPENKALADGRKVLAGEIFKVMYSDKTFILALCGGEIVAGEEFPRFSAMGAAKFSAIHRFTNKQKPLLFRGIDCDCRDGRIHDKLEETFKAMESGTTIVLVGDHARTCDGKITKHLNVQGAIELPLLQ